MTHIAILHLMNGFEDAAIGRIVQRLVTYLEDQDFGWYIGGLCGLGAMWEEFGRQGTPVVDFSDRRNGPGYLKARIREYVIDHQIRIVHSHTPRTRLATAVALVGKPQVRHLATEHSFYSARDRRWGWIYALLDRLTLYLPDHLAAVSRKMRCQIVALPGLSAKRVTAIRNAIDCRSYYVPEQRDPCRLEFGLPSESKVIGWAGRIERVKRLDLLLKGFSLVLAQYPQTRLLIIGEGKERPELESLASELRISDAVIWTGFRQDMPRLLAAMDIYVQSSSNEGLCLSILEAMAAGKPVIATDVGGAREVLTHQETGILIPSGSSSDIGAAIIDLLEHSERREALARAARDHVVQEFGVRRMVDGYRHLYEVLASQL